MIVVAGVSGHVGSAVARELLAAGKKIKVLVRDPAKGAAWAERGAEVTWGTLEDVAFLTNALRGASGFFVLLPPPDPRAPDFFAAQKRTSDSVAAAVKASGVPHVVMLSSLGAHLAEGTGHIKGMHYLETVLRETGVRLTAMRAAAFQENVASAIGPARGAGIYPCFFGSAEAAVPMIATRDLGSIAAGLLVSAPSKSEIIDALGPAYSAHDVAEKLGAALGSKPLRVALVPKEGQLAAFVQGGMARAAAEGLVEMYGAAAAGLLVPKGERVIGGKTPIDATIAALTGVRAPAA